MPADSGRRHHGGQSDQSRTGVVLEPNLRGETYWTLVRYPVRLTPWCDRTRQRGVTTMNLRRRVMLAAWCGGIAAATLPVVSTPAQMTVVPRVFHLEQLRCAELLSLPSERQDRFLIFFDGYVAGMRRLATWDERVEGVMIDRAVELCKADPSQTVLSAFIKAAPR